MKIRLKRKQWVIIAVVLLVLVLGARAFGNNRAEEEEKTSRTKSVELVDLASYRDSSRKLSANGQIESLEQVELRSEVFAPVSRVNVKLGDTVRAGQTLVIFRNGDLAADLEQARASLDAAQAQEAVQEANLAKAISSSNNSVAVADSAVKTALNNLNLNQAVETSQAVADAYDDLRILLSSTYSKINSAFVSADAVLGIDDESINSAFEEKLVNQQTNFFNSASRKYRQARFKRGPIDSAMQAISSISYEDLDVLAANMSDILTDLTDIYSDLTAMLNAAIATGGGFDQTTLDGLRTDTNTAQASVTTAQTALVNQIQAVATSKTTVSGTEIAYEKALQDLQSAKQKAEADVKLAEASLSAQQAQVKSARASVNKVGALLGKTVVRTPISGTVAVLPAKVGEIIGSGELVVSVVNTAGLQLKTFVDSRELEDVSVGNSALINSRYSGSVAYVAPSIDPQTKKVEVIIGVNDETNLVVGQFVDVDINKDTPEEEETSILLPLEAVKIGSAGKFVYVVNQENIVEEKAVEIDRVIGNSVEVISGLDGITNIISSVANVSTGEEVNIR